MGTGMIPEAIIMIGLPGAGKTTWALKNYPQALHCSADHFHEKSGVYKFDPEKAAEAHAECLRKFIVHCRTEFFRPVVVDNTNVSVVRIAPYIAIAEAYGFKARTILVMAPPDAFARGVHNVPRETWDQMSYQLSNLVANWPTTWAPPEIVA